MEEYITLAHGAGGSQTQKLIEEIFKGSFNGPLFTADDAAVLPFGANKLAITTDGFIVSPPFFPGGDIGKLAICGTVNDLSCMGAKPLYLTCSFIIEEGFKTADLKTIVQSMAKTAAEAGVAIVAGDTKVAGRGQCGGIYITTSGIGEMGPVVTGGALAKPGDAVMVTGDIGRHGCTVLCARGDYGITAELTSDCAPLNGLAQAMLKAAGDEIHVLRDATRGGVGTVLYEIAAQSGVSVALDEQMIPVSDGVRGVCGLLGLEPLYMACEGRMVVVLPREKAEEVLKVARETPYGQDATIIGEVTEPRVGLRSAVVIRTAIGGERMLSKPTGELLPRIC